MKVYVAIMETAHYRFVGVGSTKDNAKQIIQNKWDEHCKYCKTLYPHLALYQWDELEDSVNFYRLEVDGKGVKE